MSFKKILLRCNNAENTVTSEVVFTIVVVGKAIRRNDRHSKSHPRDKEAGATKRGSNRYGIYRYPFLAYLIIVL